MALKGSLPEKASLSFRQALALNPMLWEAFEGLCALGMFFISWLRISED
jgi:anaphase-promoting complex subunit 3